MSPELLRRLRWNYGPLGLTTGDAKVWFCGWHPEYPHEHSRACGRRGRIGAAHVVTGMPTGLHAPEGSALTS